MSTLRIMASALAFSATAALLGFGCAAPDEPVSTEDDPTMKAAASAEPMTLATEEDQEGGPPDLQVWPPYHAPPISPPYSPPVPPTLCTGFRNGVYCGGNEGFPGNFHTLYYCFNGVRSVVRACPNGCQAEPPGREDHCY